MVVPAPTAVTTPVDAFTVATCISLLLQVPPALPLVLYVADWPIQSGVVPLTVPALAFGFTVKVFDALTGLLQPLLTV